jgi:glycosyltransferase involved in cell wall biosynthesis
LPVRVLHAIHDFLPRHRAGSEIYARNLCRELEAQGVATHVLAAEYDVTRPHGSLVFRVEEGLGVTEVINNWAFASFAETYRSPLLAHSLAQVLDAIQPDVLHAHSLFNLSFELPRLAGARRIPTVATLHDYTLVCPSGGQRLHLAERHICREIDTTRCARCFQQTPFHAQMAFGRVALRGGGATVLGGLAATAKRWTPGLARRLAGWIGQAPAPGLSAAAIEQRLAAFRAVVEDIDLFVAPSPSLGAEFRELGIPGARLRVLDNGSPALAAAGPTTPADRAGRLRVGFVGTLVWHKGAHVLLEAARRLAGLPIEFAIAGDPQVSPSYFAELESAATGLPVRFLGVFGTAQTAEIYAQFDVLVVPSLWLENSPLVIHEAFQAGVPVVGARIGGIADLVRDGENGLLYEHESADELARCLRRLLDEPALRQRLHAGAPHVRTIADDALGWKAIYEETLTRWRSR